MYLVLAVVILLGLANTVVCNIFSHYDYREGVWVWFRRIFILALHPELMAEAPLTFQAHGLAAFLIVPDSVHSLEALEDSAVLLTVAKHR